jgi:hypothetical protein
MVFNPDTAPFVASFFQPPFEAAAQSLGLATQGAPVHSEAELEAVITALGREDGALLAMPDNFSDIHHATIIALAARSCRRRTFVMQNSKSGVAGHANAVLPLSALASITSRRRGWP